MIIRQNNTLKFDKELELIDSIPLGNWLLIQNSTTKEYYLEKQSEFKFPKKIYGEDQELAKRYVNTFNKRSKNLGILLSGDKGNGKTVTAKLICKYSKLPTILVTQPFTGEEFKSFLSNINQEVVILVDEFEKSYDTDELQQEFLTILDGIFNSKKLFIFTSNSSKINEFLKSRPGRIRYFRNYTGLSKEVIDEYIEDNLKDKEQREGLQNILSLLGNVSMDVLLHLIDEMNLYKESALEAVRKLNIQIEQNRYSVLAYIDGRRYVLTINYNPLTTRYLYLRYTIVDSVTKRESYGSYEKNISKLQVETLQGKLIFKDSDGNQFTLTPEREFNFEIGE